MTKRKAPEDIKLAGRPEVYSFTDKWEEWIQSWKATLVDDDDESKVNFPSIESLTLYLQDKLYPKHISRRTIEVYAQEDSNKPLFLRTLAWIRLAQKKRLIEEGLSGKYNSAIAKLILSANHGMSDRTENSTNVVVSMGSIIKDGKKMEFDVGD